MSMLAAYDRVYRSLAEFNSAREVVDHMDYLDHVKLHARKVQDKALLEEAIIAQLRADRRLGEMIDVLQASGKIMQGRLPKDDDSGRTTLKEIGVKNWKMSSRAQKAAALSPDEFKEIEQITREKVCSGGAILVDPINAAAKEADIAGRRAAHSERTMKGGTVKDLHELAASGFKAGFIGMDPQWLFKTRSAAGEGRSAGVHYKTEEIEKIKSIPVAALAAEHSAIGMWTVDWCIEAAFALMRHYGFEPVTKLFTWAKTNGDGELLAYDDSSWHMGMGYWTRCLVGSTRVHIYDVIDDRVKAVTLSELRGRPSFTYLIWTHRGFRRVFDFQECGRTEVQRITTRIGEAKSSLNHRWAIKRPSSHRRPGSPRNGPRDHAHVVEYHALNEIKRLTETKTHLSGTASTNLIFSTTPIEHPTPSRWFGEIPLSEEVGWLIGLFCAEGHFGTRSHKSQIRFSLNITETALADKVDDIIASFGLRGDRYRRHAVKVYRHVMSAKNGMAVYFSSTVVKRLIGEFVRGSGARGKRLDMERLLQTPVSFRRGLLSGMLQGDGTKGPHGYQGFRNLRLCNAG